MFSLTLANATPFILGAGGNATTSWISNVGSWGTGVVALIVGVLLIIRALLDVRAAVGTENKDWGKAGIGILVGILGGFIGWWGAEQIIGFFKNDGADVPKQ